MKLKKLKKIVEEIKETMPKFNPLDLSAYAARNTVKTIEQILKKLEE